MSSRTSAREARVLQQLAEPDLVRSGYAGLTTGRTYVTATRSLVVHYKIAQSLVAKGLAEYAYMDNGYIRLTEKGRAVADA